MLARTLARQLESQNVVMAQVVSTQLEADDMVRMVAAASACRHETSKAVLLTSSSSSCSCHQPGQARASDGGRGAEPAGGVGGGTAHAVELQPGEKPLLQSFMLGQPEFRRTCRAPSMEQLRQRVIASCHLGPMDGAETEAYIVHRLQTVGWSGDPSFSEDAFDAIYAHTGGIPRRINLLCDRLLLMGFWTRSTRSPASRSEPK